MISVNCVCKHVVDSVSCFPRAGYKGKKLNKNSNIKNNRK